MILVTGAAGKTGQAVMQELVQRGKTVRAFVYRPEQIGTLLNLGAKEAVAGDMRDEAAFKQVSQGVDAIYHICSNMNPNEVAIGQTAIEAARRAGVRHFVYHSVLHPQTEAMPHHWNKLRVEELLLASGLTFTILQPAAYMQNILGGWEAITREGLYRVPYPVETRLSMVDLTDVAAVAATVLTDPAHANATYQLAGPENPTQTQVAAMLSDCLNRPIQAQEISLEEWAKGARAAGLSPYRVDTLLKMFQYYAQYNFLGNSNILEWLLKRPPTNFRTFLERVQQEKPDG